MGAALCVAAGGVHLSAWSQSAVSITAAAPGAAGKVDAGKSAACPALLRHEFPKLQDGSPVNLCQFAGRVVLVVNTASYCGFTGQYEGLEALYAKYQGKGLTVLGFPSNDFGSQEPGNAKQIADFCYNTYGVKFPMMAKTVVSGPQPNSLYAALRVAAKTQPQWNFHKYLIDRSGRVVGEFPSATTPQSAAVVGAIEKALASTAAVAVQ